MRSSVFIYRFIIDPLLRLVRKEIRDQIPENSSVIDIAFGTGALLFSLTGKCSRMVGIDSDEAMVDQAKKRSAGQKLPHPDFYREDAEDLSRFRDNEFDYGVLSMAVHQFDPDIVDGIVAEASRVAAQLIIADYAIPYPRNMLGKISILVERLAGVEHFNNYKAFSAAGGLIGLIRKQGLSVLKEKYTSGMVFHICLLNKN